MLPARPRRRQPAARRAARGRSGLVSRRRGRRRQGLGDARRRPAAPGAPADRNRCASAPAGHHRHRRAGAPARAPADGADDGLAHVPRGSARRARRGDRRDSRRRRSLRTRARCARRRHPVDVLEGARGGIRDRLAAPLAQAPALGDAEVRGLVRRALERAQRRVDGPGPRTGGAAGAARKGRRPLGGIPRRRPDRVRGSAHPQGAGGAAATRPGSGEPRDRRRAA